MGDQPDFLLLVNANAGSATEAVVGSALSGLAAGGSVSVVWTEHIGDVPEAVAAHDESVPVLLGGDGTISSGIDALVRAGLAGRAVGIVPSGTGNDFARAVGIPLEPREAAGVVVTGSPRRMSLLAVQVCGGRVVPGSTTGGPVQVDPHHEASGAQESVGVQKAVGGRVRAGEPSEEDQLRHGINALHLGVGAAASRTASGWKARLGPAAYPVAAVLTGGTAPAADVTVIGADEVLFEGPAAMVACVLGRSIGGGVELSDSPPTNDVVDVLVATGRGMLDRLALGAAMLSSDPGARSAIRTMNTSRVEVRCDRDLPVNLDGEDLGESSHLALEVLPQTWTLLGPG